MPERRRVDWGVSAGLGLRMRRLARRAAGTSRARYWFPHVPLAAALTFGGLLLIWIILGPQLHLLLSNFPDNVAQLSLARMPFLLMIAVGMLIMSAGLLLRSRLAWLIALILPLTAVLMVLTVRRGVSHVVIYYNGALLVALLVAYARFDRSSLAAGTLFAITSSLLLLIYAVFGSLYFGGQFSPAISDVVTALYYAVVTMGTVGYGDIVPKTPEARLFTISVIILGLAVFATSLTAVVAPMLRRIVNRKEKRMKRGNHFVVIGATPLAYNTYREFKRRNQVVTLVLPQPPTVGEIEPEDLVVGDCNSLETLRNAGAERAQAVIAMRVDDSDNAFIVLAVRELKSPAKTVAAINDSKHMERIKLVQPDIIIAPEVLGGQLLAMVLSGEPITANFVMERFLHIDQAQAQKS